MRKSVILVLCAAGGAARAQTVQPGLWESTSKVTAVSAPDMPASVTAMMKSRPPVVSRQCVRPADAAKGFQQMFKDKTQNCVVKSSSYVGGVLDVRSQCTAQGRTSTMHMHGPYSPSAYTLASEMAMNNADMQMRTSMIVSGKRIGPCS